MCYIYSLYWDILITVLLGMHCYHGVYIWVICSPHTKFTTYSHAHIQTHIKHAYNFFYLHHVCIFAQKSLSRITIIHKYVFTIIILKYYLLSVIIQYAYKSTSPQANFHHFTLNRAWTLPHNYSKYLNDTQKQHLHDIDFGHWSKN